MKEYQITQYLDSIAELDFTLADFNRYGIKYKIKKDSKGRVALFTDYKKYETNKVEAKQVYKHKMNLCVGRGNDE